MSSLVFLDLETSGVDPHTDRILEIGFIRVDDHLSEVESGSIVLHALASEFERMSPYVRNMHGNSGLRAECQNSEYSLADGRVWLNAMLRPRDRLAGFSVHFDRAFLLEFSPSLVASLHHRIEDVSTVREHVKRWAPRLVYPNHTGPVAHRSLADCRAALAELTWYRDHLYQNRPTPAEVGEWQGSEG